jgi:hypothetical protein
MAERDREKARRATQRRRAERRQSLGHTLAAPWRWLTRALGPVVRVFSRRSKYGRVVMAGLVAFVAIAWWQAGWELGLAALGVAVLAAPVLLTIVGERDR